MASNLFKSMQIENLKNIKAPHSDLSCNSYSAILHLSILGMESKESVFVWKLAIIYNIGTYCHDPQPIFFLLIAVLSVQCKVWILPNGRDQSFATKLPSATGRFEICARKTRWISVSHICAEFSPLLSSTPALCDQQPSSAPSSWDKMIQLMFAISIGRNSWIKQALPNWPPHPCSNFQTFKKSSIRCF